MKSAKWLITIKDADDKVFASYEVDKAIATQTAKEVYEKI